MKRQTRTLLVWLVLIAAALTWAGFDSRVDGFDIGAAAILVLIVLVGAYSDTPRR